ncbi:MAG: serine/threonine protein phosphatase [Rhodospirillales bacterium]|jgi:serine/threonine protein phosphatase 1|nr:serine/threonine protein phosphatase [Rhodospirillales bacterium]
MLQKFLGQRKRAQTILPRTPPGSRIYAIGDIHGRLDLLRAINQLIHEDAYAHQAPRNVAVYLGDYIDRGDTSCAVIDWLIDQPLPGFEQVHLLGNHEDSLLQFLTDVHVGPAWLAYGGIATLHSYGVRPPSTDRDLPRVQDELRDKLPERHLAFLRGLALHHVEGDYAFVHAGLRPGVALDAQVPQDLLWIRDEFLSSNADFGKIVVHGHTIAEQPDVRRNRIGIDTGAFASGTLTSLVLAEDRWSFLQT